MVLLEFFIDIILASNGNVIFPGGGGQRRPVGRAETLPPSCGDCFDIWEFNLLEPAGTVRCYTRITLALY